MGGVEFHWEHQDTAYFRKLVARMKDTAVSDITYMDEVTDLCNVAGVYFGCIDATEDQWKSIPLDRRRRFRENTSAVFNELLHSKFLFYINTIQYSNDSTYVFVFDFTDSIHDKVTFDLEERLFTVKELKQIRWYFDSMQVVLAKYPMLHEKHVESQD